MPLDPGFEEQFFGSEVVVEPARARCEAGGLFDQDTRCAVALFAEQPHGFIDESFARVDRLAVTVRLLPLTPT